MWSVFGCALVSWFLVIFGFDGSFEIEILHRLSKFFDLTELPDAVRVTPEKSSGK